MERIDCAVIGAGVVGLAVAQAIAATGRDVVVLERHDVIGSETSSRNSEVIHAGIYYPHNSLKARLCVRGKTLLYRHCDECAVPYKRCGKMIVAVDEAQLETLRNYQHAAARNGVGDLPRMSDAQIREYEPNLQCFGAIWSPSTGIVDSHGYMLSLQMLLESFGGMIAFNTPVKQLTVTRDGMVLTTDEMELLADVVVNSGGFDAPLLVRDFYDEPPEHFPARGHYYALSGRSPFGRLVYPVAEAGGLGVHVTVDMEGNARFGPDVQWLETLDYSFDEGNRDAFAAAIKRYYPDLDESRLHPAYTGIRPKLAPKGQPAADFRIDDETVHGVSGLVNLLGIESPGLTSSLAIAEEVVARLPQ